MWDQFSRSLWRGDGRAFSNDARASRLSMSVVAALEATEGAVRRGLSREQRMFLEMPLIHSDDIAVHEWHMRRGGGGGGHYDTLRRFGRYPKRNAALGRTSTTEEEAYMRGTPDRPF